MVHVMRKLLHYFQAHTVIVLTQLSLRSILRNADYIGRIAKWGTIIGAFDVKYIPCTSIKGQVLADLVAEFAEPSLEEIAETQHMDEKSVGTISLQAPPSGNKGYLLVGIDYFSKWVEAEPLANIRDVDAKKFMWKNIVMWFKVPRTLISDNGLQFDSKSFRRYCCELGIMNRYFTLAYPKGNGEAEAVNKTIVNGLKKRLDDAKGKWIEELLHVLWTYRTAPQRSTGETPFSMTYGAEALIPLETSFPTLRTSSFNTSNNNELLEKSLDLIKERRESAIVQLAYYNKNSNKATMLV
nr:uncharacterized protein K02A2.6-like [Quercus suber]